MSLNARDTTCALLERRKLVSIAQRFALAAAGENQLRRTEKTRSVENAENGDESPPSPARFVRCGFV